MTPRMHTPYRCNRNGEVQHISTPMSALLARYGIELDAPNDKQPTDSTSQPAGQTRPTPLSQRVILRRLATAEAHRNEVVDKRRSGQTAASL